jgi:hypothetical protein
MHGLNIPENESLDVNPLEDLPYLEMLYHFIFAKKSHYTLKSTRQIEP